jgi:Family of unknown function (DUF6074)
MAMVVPFPAIRRRRFIAKTAARLAEHSSVTAEKMLAAAIRQQAAAMGRKNVAPELIERECRALENAIRAALWHAVLTPDRRS